MDVFIKLLFHLRRLVVVLLPLLACPVFKTPSTQLGWQNPNTTSEKHIFYPSSQRCPRPPCKIRFPALRKHLYPSASKNLIPNSLCRSLSVLGDLYIRIYGWVTSFANAVMTTENEWKVPRAHHVFVSSTSPPGIYRSPLPSLARDKQAGSVPDQSPPPSSPQRQAGVR